MPPPDPPSPLSASPPGRDAPAPLLPASAALLALYLDLNQDLRALAHRTGRSLPDLLAWFADPAVQDALATWDLAQARAAAAAAEADRQLALAALRKVLNSGITTEVRRAAATLLRTLSPMPPRPHPRPDPKRPPGHNSPLSQALPSVAEVMRQFRAEVAQAKADDKAAQERSAHLRAMAHPPPLVNTPSPPANSAPPVPPPRPARPDPPAARPVPATQPADLPFSFSRAPSDLFPSRAALRPGANPPTNGRPAPRPADLLAVTGRANLDSS